MITCLILVSVSYIFLILYLLYGFHQVKELGAKEDGARRTFSIVIPYRNEASHLPILLDSVRHLQYPSHLYELILVNDDSQDASEAICRQFRQKNPALKVQLLRSHRISGSPKKDALRTGITAAENEFITSSDADCRLPENWLASFNAALATENSDMLAGPVKLKTPKTSFLSSFQIVDNLSLQGASIGGFGVNLPYMCNGANLCFSKSTFFDVGGYEGNEHISSGYDVFLLE